MEDLEIRDLRAEDDPQVEAVIRTVMPEFGADGPGFAIHDPEVSAMSAAYPGGRSRYLVVVDPAGRVVGGGGCAPLIGAGSEYCELRKMYFLPAARGRGVGATLLRRLLAEAAASGFARCYLETLASMTRARALYEAAGFRAIAAPLGATGHFGCDRWYLRDLP